MKPVKSPYDPGDGEYPVFRGGGWGAYERNCRAAYRNWYTPGSRSNYLGFRVALSLPRRKRP